MPTKKSSKDVVIKFRNLITHYMCNNHKRSDSGVLGRSSLFLKKKKKTDHHHQEQRPIYGEQYTNKSLNYVSLTVGGERNYLKKLGFAR